MTPGFDGLLANDALLMTPVAEIGDYLPPFVSLWLLWLLLIAVSALILAVKKVEARFIVLAFAAAIACGFIVPPIIGAQNFVYASLSVAHMIFWTPAVIAIIMRRDVVVWKSLYGRWLAVALATMIISLVFDWRDGLVYVTLPG